MAILLEVIQESLAHLDGTPLVLFVDEGHVCGLRVAVEGYQGCSRAGQQARAAGLEGNTECSRCTVNAAGSSGSD